jgi:predicted transcriptional regulator
MVFQRISPPDEKTTLTVEDLSQVMVRRIGLKRKESRADHAMLLMELVKFRRESIPIGIDKIAQILNVSQSQSYEEIRKWRTMGLVEFVKIPSGQGFAKGYMLTAPTLNRLLDRVESSVKGFMRKTRRIAKDFDDLVMLGAARAGKQTSEEDKEIIEEKAESTAEIQESSSEESVEEASEVASEEEKSEGSEDSTEESADDLMEKPISEADYSEEEEKLGGAE